MELTKILPKIPMIKITPTTIEQIFVGIMLTIVLFILYKCISNRICVEINEAVHKGVVPSSGRYRRVYNSRTKMHELRPMLGREPLPDFPHNAFQKVKDWPFFGIKRQLTLIKLNEYTYKVALPDLNIENDFKIIDYDVKGWVYNLMYSKFENRIRMSNLLYVLSIFAPILVIILSIGIFVMAIGANMMLISNLNNEIHRLIDVLVITTGG